MEAMQAQAVDVIKRMKEITLVMKTPEHVLEAEGVTTADLEDMVESCGVGIELQTDWMRTFQPAGERKWVGKGFDDAGANNVLIYCLHLHVCRLKKGQVEITAPTKVAGEYPLKAFRFYKTKNVPTGFYEIKEGHLNIKTPWWDGSAIYGSNAEKMGRVRTFEDGKLVISKNGLLPHDDDGILISGDVRNSWIGVSVLQALFVQEHNAVCDLLKAPDVYKAAWKLLKGADGILVPGGFGDRGVQGKILAAKYARENKIPFFGICLGMQIAVIEYARSVLGLKDANSTEFDPDTKNPCVIFMPEGSKTHMGGTMRLGSRRTYFQTTDCKFAKLYGNVNYIDERHRHRYEVNPDMISELEAAGLSFVGKDETGRRMEIVELPTHPYFVGVQFHPEFKSRPAKPSALFLGLIAAACGEFETLMQTCSPLSKVAPKNIMNGITSNGNGIASNGTCVTKTYPNGNRIKSANGSLKNSIYVNGNGVHA